MKGGCAGARANDYIRTVRSAGAPGWDLLVITGKVLVNISMVYAP